MKTGEWVYLFGVSIAAAVFAGQILRGPPLGSAPAPGGARREAQAGPAASPDKKAAATGTAATPDADTAATPPYEPPAPSSLRGTPRDVDTDRIREFIRSGRLSDREARYYRKRAPAAAPEGEADDRATNKGEGRRRRRRGGRKRDGAQPEETPW